MRNDGDVLTRALDLGLADRQHKVLRERLGRHGEGGTVEDLVFQEHNRVRVPDGRLEQATSILRAVGADNLEARHLAVPRGVVLRVLRSDTGGSTVGATEHDRRAQDTRGHVVLLGAGVEDLVHRLHGKVERHELADWTQPGKCSTDGQTGEASLGDRRVNHAVLAELVKQTTGDFVRAVVAGDLLTQQEHVRVALHLLLHGRVERIAHTHLLGLVLGGEAPNAKRPGHGKRAPGCCTSSRCTRAEHVCPQGCSVHLDSLR